MPTNNYLRRLSHASCKNMDRDGRIRLATDLRFVNADGDYDTVSPATQRSNLCG